MLFTLQATCSLLLAFCRILHLSLFAQGASSTVQLAMDQMVPVGQGKCLVKNVVGTLCFVHIAVCKTTFPVEGSKHVAAELVHAM
jgi:hypothetical protein